MQWQKCELHIFESTAIKHDLSLAGLMADYCEFHIREVPGLITAISFIFGVPVSDSDNLLKAPLKSVIWP